LKKISYNSNLRGGDKVLTKEQIDQFAKLETELGIFFENKNLLRQAFMHSSYVNEHQIETSCNNERLEFLGDAVLELTTSKYLYDQYPNMTEGELTKFRSSIVCEPALVQLTKSQKFNEYLLLGRGEEQTGGRERASILADVFEAFIGALYLDQGIDAVVAFLEKVVFPKIADGVFSHVMDYKSQLQEIVQRDGLGPLSYQIINAEGPPHNRVFQAIVLINHIEHGAGSGRTKKDAEQAAAEEALTTIGAKFV